MFSVICYSVCHSLSLTSCFIYFELSSCFFVVRTPPAGILSGSKKLMARDTWCQSTILKARKFNVIIIIYI